MTSTMGARERAATPQQHRLKVAGVPSRYWWVSDQQIPMLRRALRSVTVPRPWVPGGHPLQISATRQAEALLLLDAKTPLRECSMIMAVGGVPTDELPMMFGSLLVQRAVEQKLRVRMINAAHRIAEHDEARDVVVIHNVYDGCHDMRAQVCRDLLARYDDALRVVVLGGPPVQFMHRIRQPVDTIMYFEGDSAENL